MALPADGSPILDGHQDNGKDHGKVWSNETDMVSKDHGEGLRCSSPPQSVDCATSSIKDEVGNAGTTSSSGSSTTSSSEDEVDQDDFNSRLRVVQVLRPNIKFLWGIGVLEQSLKHLNSTVDQFGSAVDRASAASQLREILPPNFQYIEDIGVAQEPQEHAAPCASLEFTSGLDKQEEPILRAENYSPVGTLQHHQVGLEKDGASSTSGRTRSTTQKVDAAEEDNLPLKLSFGRVLSSIDKFTRGLDKQEEPVLCPENSTPIGTSQHLQVGLEEDGVSLTSGRAVSISQKADSAKEEDPPLKLNFGTVLPSSFKFTCGLDKQEEPILCPKNSTPIGTSQHHQEGLEEDGVSLTSGRARSTTQKVDSAKEDNPPSKLSFGTVLPPSFKFTSELDKPKEPILRPENSTPIGTSQHHQVGMEEDRASLTSGPVKSTTQKVDSAKEDDQPLKLSFGTVLPSNFKFTSELDKPEEPILRPEDSSPISASPQPLAGWRNLVAFWAAGRARRTTEKVDDAKEDDPPSKPSDQVDLKEDVAHATSVTGINGKRTMDSDVEEQPPAKRSKDTLAEEELPKKWTRDSDDAKQEPSAKRIRKIEADDEPPSKRTRDTVAEVKLPGKRTRNSDDAKQEPSAKRIRENQAEHVLPSKRTRDSVAEEEPPAKRTRDTVAEEELPAKTTKYSDDPSWDDVLQRIGRRMAWRYGEEWENEPIPSTPLFIPYQKTDHEDPILLSPVHSPSPRTSCEDPGLSSPVLSPSYRMACKLPVLLSPIHSPSPRTSCEDPGLSSPVLSPSYRMACKLPVLLSPIHSPSPRTSCGDPGLSSPILSPSCKMPRKRPVSSSPVLSPLRGTMHEDPFLSSPDVSPSPSTCCEDPVLSPRVFSPPPRMPCEDLILSPRVFSPSPSTHRENLTLSSPDFRFWMETEKDIEEEQTPSTSGGTTARESSRHVWFRPRYALSSDSD